MKIFFSVLFFTCLLSAQTTLELPLEISTRTKGFNSNDVIRFHIDPVGTAWCNDGDDFYIDQASSSDEYVTGNHWSSPWNYGFNVCSHNQGWEYFWLCFNEMTIYLNDDTTAIAHFYLDYRDCNYGSDCGSNDLAILIEKDGASYEVSWALGLTEDYDDDPIDNEEILKYWVFDECGSHCVADLENFWQNCLVVVSNSQGHPFLVWGPHPTFSTTQFKIYRAFSSTPLAHPELSASLIETVSSTTFSYVDTDLHLDDSGDYLYYFIKAYNSSSNSYSSKTNIFNTHAYVNKIKPIQEREFPSSYFWLSDNYPNPFNPSTKIHFIIPEEGRNSNKFVQTKLIVYDVLGREVKTLFNDSISPGTYTIDFNAVELPSGVYYYNLTAGNYVQTKKMVVVK